MAISYFGSKISKNMTKTQEGFLICHNVPIARTGWYKYLESELIDNGDPIKTILVYRGTEEVFSSAAISSFEGKPVTDEHPLEMEVTSNTSKQYIEGVAQNIRRSKEEKNLLIAELIIYDQELINKIENGKREISCGYECDYIVVDGKYHQTNIRGNHIAIVDYGRAGHKVRIKDSKMGKRGMETMSRKVRKIVGKSNCDSKVEKVTVLVNQLSELVKTLTILVKNISENNTYDGIQHDECTGNQIDEENSMTVPVERINNDSTINSNIQAIGDSIYSRYNSNAVQK
ncbi:MULTISPECIES: DUF2213 domain-containing protein [Clostridium]|uniref:DUF2213 domain-containing protein n=1 Tax=Clostridium TaxID=1485 RepID=UPI00061F2FF2|nr:MULTISPECIES: DUF2213 domain-containing protein [Clostridium]CAI3620114.1 hypothetical protein CNEO3_10084 [Clostridium neonatale]KJZ91084.1 hypothetical protein ClosIBUN13A_CONTIG238g03757 [Clostridium sp. IBUN13A]MDB2157736.1 DUF2213 domain-containing protein [Clostridium butyricum]MDU1071516.1 DUF2213 domain-containing protein [Clostridium sp.]MDU1337858.1 DUF2213 domain-containing protein [Clostridium butyricum]